MIPDSKFVIIHDFQKRRQNMTDDQLRIQILEEAIRKVKTITTQGLRAQIMRGDRTSEDMFMITLRATDRIENECLNVLD